MTGRVVGLHRYPVKSMLGEDLSVAEVTADGLAGDRALAVWDVETGRVATAKYARLWRGLLRFRAGGRPGGVRITMPDGGTVDAAADGAAATLSAALGRRVRLADERPAGAAMDRPAADDVLAHGVTADLPIGSKVIAQGTAGGAFVDYASVHVITTATVAGIGAEALRFRPNLVLDTDGPAFDENHWVGRELAVGEVRLRVTIPTPRCVLPTLDHDGLGRAVQALRVPAAENRIEVPGFGVLPCAGVYADVLTPGRIRVGDPWRLVPDR